ncbi:dihydroorotase [Catalinimonas niigatensis]|uniref:dihydroorotase n=1 Tax=Catalinimonas niigatensis TaxID=1397264 RepID=UPI002666E1A8|nr:dihydroorotase [Catalinimonas niigatensis]WPP52244.1 dihydroorotase [Catalinimonas niigatensis]
MKVLLRSVRLIHKSSPFHQKEVDILIEEGIIKKLVASGDVLDLKPGTQEIDAQGKLVSVGWFDMQASFSDPGEEHKEDIQSGTAAAMAGGFTEVALLPNTQPVIQTKSEIRYLKEVTGKPVKIHPIAAVTRDTKGEELTEMIDLHYAGAVAFSDGLNALWHTQVMLKALQYMQKMDSLLINRPEDMHLNKYGDMHEGLQSTILGMKGMPVLAETLAIERDLRLLEYVAEMSVGASPRLHFSNISSQDSVRLIREAKQKGLAVSCDVAAHQLYFTDEALADFDTNLRVNPPLRTEADRQALIEGVKDGTIDVIVSSHQPHDEESKKCEFEMAAFGMTGLQTVLPILNHVFSQDMLQDSLLEKITAAPRALLRSDQPAIEEGAKANITLFDLDTRWKLNGSSNKSKSKNSPFWDKELKGKVWGTFYQDLYWTDL